MVDEVKTDAGSGATVVDFVAETKVKPRVEAVKEDLADTKPTVIIDTILSGSDGVTLKVHGDLEFLLGDIADYLAKMKDARNIPQDGENILPDHPVFELVENIPEVKALPSRTRKEQEDRARYIMDLVHKYFARLTAEANNAAIILALTLSPENVFTEDPKPYEKVEIRQRPGLITLPEPEKNLSDPVERRFKQVFDRIIQIPGALAVLNEAIDLMSVNIRQRVQLRDRDGFRSK